MQAEIATISEQVLPLYRNDPRVHAVSVCLDEDGYGVYVGAYPGSGLTSKEVKVNIGDAEKALKVHVEEGEAATPWSRVS